MARARIAVALAVVAVLAVLATAALAVTTYVGGDDPDALAVTDPGTGARFEVPGKDWAVRGARSRIYYEDDAGKPVAVVTGPAVYRDGSCAEQPGDSNRGFAGFTQDAFDAWRAGLGGGPGEERRDPVELADGREGTVRWVRLPGGSGPCAAAGIELAMLSSGGVRVVVVADAGEAGTLAHGEIVRILRSLRPPA
ncbi:hypothetical protein [Nocardioides conyzicola]|uniref:DUF8017 domain-containing protein n=1 Tax=Nocardioides conyzicola TaxID=1651781 RepID=A0ABP8XL63_9ACTN